MTSQYITIVFKSVVRKKGNESFRINAILGLGLGSNPGPLAPESCVLPCAPLHIPYIYIYIYIYIIYIYIYRERERGRGRENKNERERERGQ